MKKQISKYFAAPLVTFATLALVILSSCDPIPFPIGGDGGGGGAACPPGLVTETYYLRAEPFIMAMEDGATVPMWGYAKDSEFEALDGVVSSPGPILPVNYCTNDVRIRLDNNLAVPTSIVVNGWAGGMVPVYNPDGRVRSFTTETAPGNIAYVEYRFLNPKAGTFLYQSGTHIQVQRQMGLYGAVTKNQASHSAYGGPAQELELRLVYSEIDPDLHSAVAAGQFGAGLTMTSTVDYYPKYFLINGVEYSTAETVPVSGAMAHKRALFRILNAGLKPRTFMLVGGHFEVVAEGGNPYTYPQSRYTMMIEPGSTKDIIINLPTENLKLVWDRALGV